MSDIVTKAAAYAKAAHESIDQRRKFTGKPYIVHPEAVAGHVSSVTDDEGMIAAAWLHDVVEDTPITLEQVEAEFGPDVASLVDNLTKVATESDGNRAAREAIDRQHTAAAAPRAKTVKLADVIDNVSDITRADHAFAVMYTKEKEVLLEVLTEGHPELYKKAQEVIRKSKEVLASRET